SGGASSPITLSNYRLPPSRCKQPLRRPFPDDRAGEILVASAHAGRYGGRNCPPCGIALVPWLKWDREDRNSPHAKDPLHAPLPAASSQPPPPPPGGDSPARTARGPSAP